MQSDPSRNGCQCCGCRQKSTVDARDRGRLKSSMPALTCETANRSAISAQPENLGIFSNIGVVVGEGIGQRRVVAFEKLRGIRSAPGERLAKRYSGDFSYSWKTSFAVSSSGVFKCSMSIMPTRPAAKEPGWTFPSAYGTVLGQVQDPARLGAVGAESSPFLCFATRAVLNVASVRR